MEFERKIEQQEKENEELTLKIEKLTREKSTGESAEDKKEVEEYDNLNKQIEKLKAELKKAESNKSELKHKGKKSGTELEVLFKERSGEAANLQKCIAQAKLTLEQLQKEESPENTPTASPRKPNPNDKARPQRKRPTERAELEKALKENKEWKERCNAMAQQLFEAKVAWAEENNGYQKGICDLARVYNYAITRLGQLQYDYANVKAEYDKIDKRRKKYLPKKK